MGALRLETDGIRQRQSFGAGGVRCLCAAFAILALAPAHGPSAASTTFGDWPAVFDPLNLRTLHLELAPSDWATVQNDASLLIEVPAYFHEAGETPILV